MKKSAIIGGTAVLMTLGGCGAWLAYKKHNPNGAKNLKKNMKQMTKNVEKSIEDMM